MKTDENILGRNLAQLIDLLLQIMKETEPEEYEQLMKRNEVVKQQRLAKETKENKKKLKQR